MSQRFHGDVSNTSESVARACARAFHWSGSVIAHPAAIARPCDEAELAAYALVEAERDAIAHAVGIGAVKFADLSSDRVGDYAALVSLRGDQP